MKLCHTALNSAACCGLHQNIGSSLAAPTPPPSGVRLWSGAPWSSTVSRIRFSRYRARFRVNGLLWKNPDCRMIQNEGWITTGCSKPMTSSIGNIQSARPQSNMSGRSLSGWMDLVRNVFWPNLSNKSCITVQILEMCLFLTSLVTFLSMRGRTVPTILAHTWSSTWYKDSQITMLSFSYRSSGMFPSGTLNTFLSRWSAVLTSSDRWLCPAGSPVPAPYVNCRSSLYFCIESAHCRIKAAFDLADRHAWTHF